MKKIISVALILAVFCALAAMPQVRNVRAEGTFDTNMTGWTAVDGSTWSVTDRGFESDKISSIEAEPMKFFAKSDTVIDGKKSFRYEIGYVNTHGYGVGLSLVTVDRQNFYAIEVNVEGKVYFPTMTAGSWGTYAPYGTDLTQEEMTAYDGKEHTLVFEYNAEDGTGKVTLDGVLKAETSIPGKALKGNPGLYFEDADVYFTKAIFTETGSEIEQDFKKFMETNMNFEPADGADWEYTKDGYMCPVSGGRHLAKSDIVIEEDVSFRYEVTFDYTGYGAGMAFGAVDPENFSGVEINIEGNVYFPQRIEDEWSNRQNGFPLTDTQKESTQHTVVIEYDAYDWCGEVYVDGDLKMEVYDLGPDVICGSLGLFFEDATVKFSKAVYTRLETRTPAPQTPTPEATAAPTSAPTDVPASPTEAPKTSPDVKKDNGGLIWIIAAAALVVIIAAAVIVVVSKKKK